MFVEFDPKTRTYSIREGKLVRSHLSEKAAKQIMAAPEPNCEAIMRVARSQSRDGGKQ